MHIFSTLRLAIEKNECKCSFSIWLQKKKNHLFNMNKNQQYLKSVYNIFFVFLFYFFFIVFTYCKYLIAVICKVLCNFLQFHELCVGFFILRTKLYKYVLWSLNIIIIYSCVFIELWKHDGKMINFYICNYFQNNGNNGKTLYNETSTHSVLEKILGQRHLP